MTAKSQDTKTWKAKITVTLTPINSYGDVLGDSVIDYSVYLDGSLISIVTKLEGLRE